uniref:Cobalt-precorrin-5B C(1)-methyltransferase n=1 Tax=Candidatus Kentrum sp. TUN TaxID=2126343 RepID=A0A450ZIW3_9GAMM|nr:MAG: cobalt-precorrin-5B (C1)-methyltransferase [Candidatus Kentron sp. TUN]VFK55286.1 MAG: cobalt-precorrin-5B (C1)-methyltransferase [Candidatus Kentron sp. TUN]
MSKGRKRRGTRTGFSTGANAAAAARAAALGLAIGTVPETVQCDLPKGDQVVFPVLEGHRDWYTAHAVVVKDAGDDPDVTDKARLTTDLRLLPDSPGQVVLEGGDGVGTVTIPGLGLTVGEPAINPVPRRNIEQNVRVVAANLLRQSGIVVCISVPDGKAMARRTLNPRLGIMGGISILGTTGIVRPYSTAAFRDSVIQAVEVAAAQGQQTVVLTTGGRTERFAMGTLPTLASACFVQMGDFVGHALETVVRTGIRQVVVVGMVGKLTKIVQDERITHAGRNPVNMALVADMAAAVGASEEVCDAIRQACTARYASERMAELTLSAPFYQELARRTAANLAERHPGAYQVRVIACGFKGEWLAEAIHD